MTIIRQLFRAVVEDITGVYRNLTEQKYAPTVMTCKADTTAAFLSGCRCRQNVVGPFYVL